MTRRVDKVQMLMYALEGAYTIRGVQSGNLSEREEDQLNADIEEIKVRLARAQADEEIAERKDALMKAAPYLRVPNKLEFQWRLGKLAEGMLRNHMESIINYTVDQDEIELYRKYRAGEPL